MEPTLLTGEKLFVARCAYGLALPWLAEALVDAGRCPSVAGDVSDPGQPAGPRRRTW